ncbi:MAG TPA: MMPL family transporter [Candidatus Saccharimonadales bacterium]
MSEMLGQKIPKNDTEGIGYRIFAAIGRFSVRFRWLIVVVWILGAVVAVKLLPPLSSAIQTNNSNFLPANSLTEKALKISEAFGNSTSANPVPVVIAEKSGGVLSAADQGSISRLQADLARLPKVKAVKDAGLSNDGKAYELVALINASGSINPTDAIGSLRSAIAQANLPVGLEAHLAGDLAAAADNSKKAGTSNTDLELGSVIFIIALLLVIFRAPLAPLITLVPPLFVTAISGPLIGELARHGLKVSSITQLLLTVLIIGAGTDYGLFLIFRVREEMRGGLTKNDAIARALSRVGESITFSAATVIAALLSLMLASFELYSDLGAPLAIGIGLMLVAGLTLLPALLAIFGRAAFWPSKRYKPNSKSGFWGRISSSVVRRPVAVLIAGIVVFGGLAISVTGYKAAGFGGQTGAPAGSDSAAGNALLARHFPSGSANPTGALFVLPQTVWQNPAPAFAIQAKLAAAPEFKAVSGPFGSGAGALTPAKIAQLYQRLGPPARLPKTYPAQLAGSGVSPLVYQVYRQLVNYISPSGKIVQYEVVLAAGDPNSTAAMNATPAERARVDAIAKASGAVNSGLAGEAPALYDINHISNSDLVRVIPIAVLIIGVLLAILLRSLVAPLYLIISVVMSYLASLGLAVLLFITLGHESGLTFVLPFLMFIFLLALGEDYNILVMTRIREEAHGMPLRQAVSQALTTTGTTVTSAGLVLAGTFAVLAFVGGAGDAQIRDIGAGLALGILMDTFLVRTLIVPSIVVLLGKWNWWPTRHGWSE